MPSLVGSEMCIRDSDFSEQGAFRWIQKTSMDQRIPKKRLAMAIIAKYGDPKPSEVGE